MYRKKTGFTLVELLAVIVILAIILVIAVPKIMSVIEDTKKSTLESTVKMIASSAEKAQVQNTLLGNNKPITCDSVAQINDVDYEKCIIEIDNDIAKVTIKGSGKFDNNVFCTWAFSALLAIIFTVLSNVLFFVSSITVIIFGTAITRIIANITITANNSTKVKPFA